MADKLTVHGIGGLQEVTWHVHRGNGRRRQSTAAVPTIAKQLGKPLGRNAATVDVAYVAALQ